MSSTYGSAFRVLLPGGWAGSSREPAACCSLSALDPIDNTSAFGSRSITTDPLAMPGRQRHDVHAPASRLPAAVSPAFQSGPVSSRLRHGRVPLASHRVSLPFRSRPARVPRCSADFSRFPDLPRSCLAVVSLASIFGATWRASCVSFRPESRRRVGSIRANTECVGECRDRRGGADV